MGWLADTVVVAGLTSLALLWVLSIAGALHVAWDTVGEHLLNLVDHVKRRLRR